MNVKVSKCSIPVIWLDTSIIIKMALWKLGRPLNEVDQKRIPELYNFIYELVRKGELICPHGDRDDEIWIGEDVCREVATSLSLGIKFRHRGGIQNLQTQRFMETFIAKINDIELPYADAFYGDPVEEIRRKDPFIITVNRRRYESIDDVKKRIAEMQKSLESIRIEAQNLNESFEERLDLEYKGYLSGTLHLGIKFWDKIKQGVEPSFDDFMVALSLGLPLAWWNRYNGQPPGLQGMIKFYLSDAFKATPVIEITCKLYSDILTQSTKIESGDSIDVQQLAAVSPYCQIVITDRKMKNRFNKLRLDQKYQVKVCSLSDYDEIKKFLEDL